MVRFTQNNLQAIFPTTSKDVIAGWIEPLNTTVTHYDITSSARAAAFIAQVGHESGGLTAIRENLSYSQQGLMKTFGKYFPDAAIAGRYARNPQMIASRVYANRGGNGDEASQDGWKYRGRGLIQCTFRDTYKALGDSLKISLADVPAYLETNDGAAMSAGWFWSTRNLNLLADQGRFIDITKKINGGVNGLEARKELWAKARAVLI